MSVSWVFALACVVLTVLEQGSGPSLIVTPLAVLNNWMREFARFAPHVKLCRYYGTQEERAALREEHIYRNAYDASGRFLPRRLPVFITTYHIAMNDRKYLAPLQWSFLCVDEGHRMKNINSRLKSELTHYTSHEDGASGIIVTRLLLTGTPLQVRWWWWVLVNSGNSGCWWWRW